MLLPFQGDRLASIITQGVALGCELLPFQGVLGNFNRTGRDYFNMNHRKSKHESVIYLNMNHRQSEH